MSALADRLQLIADRVSLAEQWALRGDPDRAADHLDGVYADLVTIIEEVDR